MEKFNTNFKYLLEFLFPKTVSENIVDQITAGDLLEKAETQVTISNDGVLTLFKYHDRTIKELIWAFKYRRKTKVAGLFAEVLYENLLEKLSDDVLFSNFTHPIIIPIPLSKRRMRERGFNQTELMAEQLKRKDKANFFDMQADVLIRVRETEHQARMQTKEERLKNVRGAFAVKGIPKIKNRNIILLDDVITTGSTMREAQKVLVSAGAKKIMIVAVAG